MKTLYLMRHAQAESHGPTGDASRALTDAGREAARAVGATLAEAGIQHALVSSAVRTRQTFEALGIDCHAEFMDILYHGGTEDLAQRIGEVEEDVQSLLVVGHSPMVPAFAAELLYRSARHEADQLLCHFPTATLTALEVEGPWDDLFGHPVHLRGVNRASSGQATGCARR